MSAHDIRSAAVPPEQMKRQARRLAEEVFTQGDLGVVGDVIGDAYLDHGPALSSRTGPAGLTDRVTALRRAFPDLYLPSRRRRFGWHALLVAAACATIASFAIALIIAGSIEAFFLAMAAPIALGLLLVWRWRRTGIVVLGVVLLAELLSSAPFLVDALTHPESPGDFLPLTLFTVATLVGSVAAVPAFRAAREPGRPASRSAVPVAVVAVAALVAATAVSVVAAGRVDSVTAQPGDVELTTQDFRFGTSSVTADAGTVAVTVTNDDATRHTFTIDELGVNLDVPPGTTQRVTFPADAGTFRFYCIPHAGNMTGQLVLR